jgi:hypothetical protein
MASEFALVMAGAAAAHQAATASREETGQQRADRTRRTSADLQLAQQGATSAATASPAALDSLSRLQQLADTSPQVVQLRRLQALADGRFAPVAQLAGGPEEEELVQGKFGSAQLQPQLQQVPRANNTGLPDQLKRGIETLSGLSMDHVRVHYNSSQPAQLNALAFAQGSDIHLAPGQEQHLPHEAWHVVQQAQGRVRPTLQMKEGVTVNDDVELEREADEMGLKSAKYTVPQKTETRLSFIKSDHMPVQRVIYNTMAEMWAAVEPTQTEAQIKAITNADPELAQVYTNVEAHLANMDFIYDNARQPEAEMVPDPTQRGIYRINYGRRGELQGTYNDVTRYIGAILHEMMHITSGLQYATNVPAGGVGHIANMNLPVAVGQVALLDAEFGLTDNQFNDLAIGAAPQLEIMFANWDHLSEEADLDEGSGRLTEEQVAVIKARIEYAKVLPGALAHYDTVLTDLLYYLRSEGVDQSRAYEYAHRMLTEANARRLAALGAVQAIPRAPLPIPVPPPQSFFQYLFSCCMPIQRKAIGINNETELEQEADYMGALALGNRSQYHSRPATKVMDRAQRKHDTTSDENTKNSADVLQLGGKASKSEQTYYNIKAEDAGYTYKWTPKTELEVFTQLEDEPVGFARFSIDDTVFAETPKPDEQYTFQSVLDRETGKVAHLHKIWNTSLTREGPNHIYRGFAVELMKQVEDKAKSLGARMIYLEPSSSDCRKDPNTNDKESIDPTGFYLKLGYSYDQTATEHNSRLVDRQFEGLPPDQKEILKTKMNLAALGGVLQKPLR